jgi:hypothetical protein
VLAAPDDGSVRVHFLRHTARDDAWVPLDRVRLR